MRVGKIHIKGMEKVLFELCYVAAVDFKVNVFPYRAAQRKKVEKNMCFSVKFDTFQIG